MNTSKHFRMNAGFTLVELVVVMMVLIALAGILLPQFSGMVNRAHTSSASTNLTEINKAVNLYQVKRLKGYPDKVDLLTDSSGKLADTLLPGANPNPPTGGSSVNDLTAAALDAGQLASLNGAGITTGYQLLDQSALASAGLSATFSGTNLTSPVPLAVGTKVAIVSDARAQAELGSTLPGAAGGETYVAFGLNDSCTAIPSAMLNAPVHFDQNFDPAVQYGRDFLIYAIPVTGTTGTAVFNARYVGCTCPDLEGLKGHLSEYYGKDSQ